MNNIDIETLLDGTATIETKIEILNSRGEVETTLTNEDSVKTWELSDLRYVPDAGFLGKFVERNLEGTLQNISENFNIENREIVLYLGMRRYVDSYTDADLEVTGNAHSIIHGVDSKLGSYITTFYSLGNFIVDKPSDDEVKDNTRYTAKDYTIKFNIAFNGDYTSVEFPKSFNTLLNENGSVTAEWLARYTCNQAGVELGSTDFVNNNFRIPSNQFDSGDQCRDVMKYIGKLAYSWVRVDWDNKVYIDFKVKKTVDLEYNNITKDDYYTLETQKETYGAINKVALGSSIVEGLYSYVEDSASIATNGEKVLVINDNPILYTDELRNEAVKTGNVLFGLTYTPIVTETTGHPWLKGNELISIVTSDDSVIYSYPFDRILKYNGHIKTEIASYAPTKVEEDYNYTGTGTTSNQFKYTRVLLDRNTQMLTSYMEKTDNNSSQISSFEQNLEGAVVRVTNVEKGLNTTNTNLQTTNKNVTNLQTQINGVSADFEDFKDNEYVQSINNLQSQIDGAIQFWNGADIPTLNNYPAINWKTEADKVNHQADIYTVIKDVSGELKQGKAYRFDKVNGVWQWIELTDNELSAVQALAQEALNKANTNTSDIKVLKQTDTEIKADINGINLKYDTLNNDYQANLTTRKSVSGNPVYIPDSGGYALEKDFIYGMSIQEIRSGKNLYNVNDVYSRPSSYISVDSDDWITLTRDNSSGTSVTYINNYVNPSKLLKVDTTYYIVFEVKAVSGTGSINVISLQATNAKGQFATTNGFQFANLKAGDIKKITAKTISDFSGCITMLRNFATFETGQSGSITYRISVFENEIDADNFIYEKYGAMPSPDYPSEIINNRGIENLFNVLDTDNFVFRHKGNSPYYQSFKLTDYSSNEIKVSGGGGNYTQAYIDISNLKPNTNYNLSYEISQNDFVFSPTMRLTSDTTDSEGNITIQLDLNNGSTIASTQNYVVFTKIKLEEGSIVHSYLPYGSNYLVQTICGKNLAKLFRIGSSIANGVTTTLNENGTITLNGTCTSDSWVEIAYKFGYGTSQQSIPVRKLQSGEKYSFSFKEKSGSMNGTIAIQTQVNSSGGIISVNNTNLITNSTTNSDGIYRTWIYVKKETILNDYNVGFQIEKGEATDFEPCKEKVIKYDLQGNKLCAKDNAELVGGVLKKNIKEIVLTGNETITENTVYSGLFILSNIAIKSSEYDIVVTSTHFKGIAQHTMFIDLETGYNNDLVTSAYTNNRLFIVYKEYTKNLSGFKAFLKEQYEAGTPVVVQYVLAKPQTIQLEPVEVELFEGVNNVYTESNVDLDDVDIVYLTDSVLNSQYATRSELQITEDRIQTEVSSKTTILETGLTLANNKIDTTNVNLQNQITATNESLGNYATNASVVSIQNSVSTINTSLQSQILITKDIQENGVSKVKTATGFTFDENGLTIDKTGAVTKTNIDEDGMVVYSTSGTETEMLKADSTGVVAENLTSRKYFVCGSKSRFEDYSDGTGCFYIG